MSELQIIMTLHRNDDGFTADIRMSNDIPVTHAIGLLKKQASALEQRLVEVIKAKGLVPDEEGIDDLTKMTIAELVESEAANA